MIQVNTILKRTTNTEDDDDEHTTFSKSVREGMYYLGMLTSAAFVAEGVTYLVYMKDISEESRRTGKQFYGFIPLSGKKLYAVKSSMFILSFCQLLGKAMQVAVLMQIGKKTLVIKVLGCELGVFLLYKVVRSDFRYW